MPRNKLNEFDQNIRNEISKNLRTLIKQHGLSQRSLAEKSSIAYTTISGYFNAKSTPNAGAVEKMSEALGVLKSDIDPRFNDGFKDGMQVVTVNDFVNIPLIGDIACGKPIFAEQNIEGYIPTEKADLPSGTLFWLNCKGTSMEPTLPNGSKVLIHKQPIVEDGEMAAVLIDDEVTLKRIKHVDSQILLMPDNRDFEPLLIDGHKNIRILGKVIELKRRF